MVIMQVNDNYNYLGGSEKYFLDVCDILEQMGSKIIVASLEGKPRIAKKNRAEYFLEASYGLRGSIKAKKIFQEIIEKENPDVIHLHNTQYFLSPLVINFLRKIKPTIKFVHDPRLLCPMLGKKVLPHSNVLCKKPVGGKCFIHCYPFLKNKKSIARNIYHFYIVYSELRVTKRLDKVVVGSRYMYDELFLNGVPRDKVVILPLFFRETDTDINLNTIENRTHEGVILWVGRFDGSKDGKGLLKALSLLKNSTWRAFFAGDGPHMHKAVKYAKEKGIYKQVNFLGKIPFEEMDELYEQCSFLVLTAKVPESFGLSGIEAMSKGKPVIAYDNGAVKEWLIDGVTGILVKRGDVRGLSIAIERLLGNKNLIVQLGASAYQRVKKHYSEQKHFKELMGIYNNVIKLRGLDNENRN